MILYFECFSGISGDMTVSSLLDLGADKEVLLSALKSLNLDGYKIEISRMQKCGIDACNFNVILDSENNHTHEHSHGDSHGHSHGNSHRHVHKHQPVRRRKPISCISKKYIMHRISHMHAHMMGHAHEHSHSHTHAKGHSHSHGGGHSHSHGGGHSHSHGEGHVHRNINDITKIINESGISDRAKTIAIDIFGFVARSEAKAHNLPIDKVHFHEVGAVDSIVDIVAVAVCIDNLNIDKICVSSVHEGQGHVKCQHGIIPVPVPAVINIAKESGIPLRITNNRGEMVTPTGMAIIASLKNSSLPDSYSVKNVGLGAGKKDFPHANILRAILIEENQTTISKPQDISIAPNDIFVLETNIDDSSAESLGYTMDKLLQAGANDVFFTPIFMKKNRPATMLSLLCEHHQIELMEDIIFSNLSTIGIRKFKCERDILSRNIQTFDTPFGKVDAKVCQHKDQTYIYPEFESVKKICDNQNQSFDQTYTKIKSYLNSLRLTD